LPVTYRLKAREDLLAAGLRNAGKLLLQGGGFSAIVLDMGSIAPEYVVRVPLATWFRYPAAAERNKLASFLLTQYPSAKSSVELLLRFKPGDALRDETIVSIT
jgi:recombination protein RecA